MLIFMLVFGCKPKYFSQILFWFWTSIFMGTQGASTVIKLLGLFLRVKCLTNKSAAHLLAIKNLLFWCSGLSSFLQIVISFCTVFTFYKHYLYVINLVIHKSFFFFKKKKKWYKWYLTKYFFHARVPYSFYQIIY